MQERDDHLQHECRVEQKRDRESEKGEAEEPAHEATAQPELRPPGG